MKLTTFTSYTSHAFKAAVLLSACLLVPAYALGQGNSQRGSDGRNDDGARERGNQESLVVLDLSVDDARRLARTHNLTGYESLPPGIRKNLARGKPLPPGLARRAVPGSMLASLPVIGGHEWQVAGQDLVLISAGTQLVVEILNDVFQ